ncbi:MAG: hypothetical protein HPY81_09425 [Firmicutes bacterium]|nr:hypothetical protein [Bacillota bacterium]
MNVEGFLNLVLLLALIISLYSDIVGQKIYNAVLAPAVLLGLGLNAWAAGFDGLLFSLKGLGVGLAVLLLPFLMGGLGAGDVKLMATVGAIKGALFVLYSFFATALFGGLLSILVLLRRKIGLAGLQGLGRGLYILLVSHGKVNTLDTLDNLDTLDRDVASTAFPYGVAIVLGTLTAFWWMG